MSDASAADAQGATAVSQPTVASPLADRTAKIPGAQDTPSANFAGSAAALHEPHKSITQRRPPADFLMQFSRSLAVQVAPVADGMRQLLGSMEPLEARLQSFLPQLRDSLFPTTSYAESQLAHLAKSLSPAMTQWNSQLLQMREQILPLTIGTRSLLAQMEPATRLIAADLTHTMSLLRSPLIELQRSLELSLRPPIDALMPKLDGLRSLASCFAAASLGVDLQLTLNSISALSPLANSSASIARAAESLHSSMNLGGLLHLNSWDSSAGVFACWNDERSAHAAGVTTSKEVDHQRIPTRRGFSLELLATVKPVCSRCGKAMPAQSGKIRVDLAGLLSRGLEVEIPILPLCECIADWDGTPEDLLRRPFVPLLFSVIDGGSEGDRVPSARLRSVGPKDGR